MLELRDIDARKQDFTPGPDTQLGPGAELLAIDPAPGLRTQP